MREDPRQPADLERLRPEDRQTLVLALARWFHELPDHQVRRVVRRREREDG